MATRKSNRPLPRFGKTPTRKGRRGEGPMVDQDELNRTVSLKNPPGVFIPFSRIRIMFLDRYNRFVPNDERKSQLSGAATKMLEQEMMDFIVKRWVDAVIVSIAAGKATVRVKNVQAGMAISGTTQTALETAVRRYTPGLAPDQPPEDNGEEYGYEEEAYE